VQRVVADPGDRVAGDVIDWPERGGQRRVEQLAGPERLSVLPGDQRAGPGRRVRTGIRAGASGTGMRGWGFIVVPGSFPVSVSRHARSLLVPAGAAAPAA
jgi:hypothetical protein